jgi:hypothetical protein
MIKSQVINVIRLFFMKNILILRKYVVSLHIKNIDYSYFLC